MNSIYKIKEFPIYQYIARLALLGWSYFAYTKFDVNPNFFGFTIIIAIITIFLISQKSIVATKDSLLLKHESWMPILNKTKQFRYSEVSDITYEKGKIEGLTFLLNLIEYIPGTVRKKDRIIILKKDGSSTYIEAVGNKKEVENLISIVKEELKTTYNNV